MASITTARMTQGGPPIPAMGTYSAAANSLYPKGTIVCRDSAGRAYAPTTADASGNPAVGICAGGLNNLTGSELGGAADAADVEVTFGVEGWDISGDAPLPGQIVYVVDNHTVSGDSAGGTRGVAGIAIEVRANVAGTNQCYTLMGPHFANEAMRSGAALRVDVPLTTGRLASGAAIPAFTGGSADGFELTDSEVLALRINDDSTTVFVYEVSLPPLDGGALVLHVEGFRVGSTDPADVALTVGAFFHQAGAAHTADANAGGETSAFTAATTIISEETLTIAADDVPAGATSLTLTLQVTAELDADDLCLTRMWLTGGAAA